MKKKILFCILSVLIFTIPCYAGPWGTGGGGTTVDNTPYNATSWNDNTDAATKDAIRDKIETLAGGHDPVTIGTANGLSLSTQALSLAAATNSTPGAATAAQITALEKVDTDAEVVAIVESGATAFEPADAAIVKSDEAETLSANWVNTAHPWAANEGGTGLSTIVAWPIGATAFSDLNAGDTYTYGDAADDTINELFDAVDTAIGGKQASNAYLTDIAGITPDQGDVLYFDGTDWKNLGHGVNGQFLKTQGAAANPTWDDPAGSGDITAVGDSESGNAFTADGTGNNLYFEGTTPNAYEILVTGANPGADVTVTIPAETGSVVLGPAGFGTDNLLTKTNGTGNLTQATGIAVDDSNNMSNIGTIGSGTVTSSGAVSGSTVTDGTVTLAGDGTITGVSEGGLPNSVVVSADIKNGEVASEDLAATLDLSGKAVTFGLETTDIPDLSGIYEAVDAEIARMDTADTVSADWEWQDGIAQSFGNDNDWEVAYDEAGDDRLEFSSNSAGTTSVAILNAGAGVANLVVDGVVNEGGIDLASKYQGLNAYLTDISNISGPSTGDLMYFDGTDWVAFAPGTNGYFLQSQGDGVALTWASGSSTGVNETYGSGWNADQGAPEKDDVYDYLHQFDADDDGSFADETWLANYMAAPGAIGGTTPAAITGTTITGTTFVIAGTADGGQYVSMLEDTDNGTNYSGWGVYGDLAASALYAPPLAASAGGQAMVFAAPGNQTMSDGTDKSVSVGTWITPIVSGGAIGTATATTPDEDDNDTSVATTAYVQTEISGFGTPKTEEEIEDYVGGMLGGTETRITVTYDDGGNAINFVVDDMNDTRDSLGVDTDDSPQFAAVNIGAAADTTLARSGAGDLTVEGNAIYRAGGTDVPITDGGTGASTAAAAASALGVGTEDSPQFTGIELGHASENTLSASGGVLSVESVVIPSVSSTNTLTNKRITPRVGTTTSSATPTINTDNYDAYSITALAADITSMTTNLSGTPTDFQKLLIRIKDDGTARGITWGASFEAKGIALPTTTTISKVLTVAFLYDTVTSKWGCVGSVEEE